MYRARIRHRLKTDHKKGVVPDKVDEAAKGKMEKKDPGNTILSAWKDRTSLCSARHKKENRHLRVRT